MVVKPAERPHRQRTGMTRVRPIEDRRKAQDLMIHLLRANMDVSELQQAPAELLQGVAEEAIRHRLGAVAWRGLSDASIASPPEVVEDLRQHYLYNAFRNAILFRETADAATALAAESIPVMLLKGIHLARFVYAEPALRSMADIDLMVPRSRIADAERILVGMGYGPLPRGNVDERCAWSNHLATLEKPGAEILEVHYDIERPTSPFSIDVNAIWRSARAETLDGAAVVVPATEHLLLHLCIHVAYHHRFERTALKGLVDIATVIRDAGPIDWDAMVKTANAANAGPFVYAALRLARDVLGADVLVDALDALDRADSDEAVITIAKRYILTPSFDVSETMVEIQRTRGWRKRLALTLRSVFPSPARLREIYRLEPDSMLVWTLYPVRVANLLIRRGGLLARIAARTPSASSIIDRERDRRRIEEWAGHGDAQSDGRSAG
jgi:hypothetical protein